MSSAYDAAVVDTAMVEDERMLALPRGVRLLHLEALVWSKLHRTDGRIPAGALPRITDEEDPRQAAAQLVEAGLWSMSDAGWTIADFAETQMTRSRVESRIEAQRKARDEYEKRHPNRPRRGRDRTDVSREQSDEESDETSGDITASQPARLPAKAGAGGRRGAGAQKSAAPALVGSINGRPVEAVASELRRDHQDRYAHETLEGHLGDGR